jgi:hypothetical protein
MSLGNYLTESELVRIVNRILETKPPLGEWYSGEGGCIDLSEQLQKALEKRGVITERVEGRGHISLKHSTQNKNDPISIDPTYLQFFANGVERGMPKILVGTIKSIGRLLTEQIQAGIESSIDGIEDLNQFICDHYIDTKPYAG